MMVLGKQHLAGLTSGTRAGMRGLLPVSLGHVHKLVPPLADTTMGDHPPGGFSKARKKPD
jgi:hypothetical protein